MMVKMIQDVGKTMEKMQEMFTKDLQELKNKQTEMNDTLEGINSRVTEAEEQINDMEKEWWKSLPHNRMHKKKKRNEDP